MYNDSPVDNLYYILMNKLVHFGAGKIGRSFIGQLFSRAGYEVVFVDIFQPVIDALNERKAYKVVIKANDGDSEIMVHNVRGVNANEKELVADEVASANVLSISVGQRGLPHIIPLLANGLIKRYNLNPARPLDIIIAENMRNADQFIEEELKKLLPQDYPFHKLVGLVETSIGKMVPIMTKKDMEEDILQVFAEPYNTLILDKKGFKNPVPEVKGLAPKDNMKAWVDRKLFIHNLGHATTAYLGFLENPDFKYVYEVLAVPALKKQVRETMLQSGDTLMKMYPAEFDLKHIIDHTDDLILRFENKALGDTIYRVGCDLKRKLSRNDRLAGAIINAKNFNMPYDKILYALVSGFYFRARDEEGNLFPGDKEFDVILQKGIPYVMTNICGFNPRKDKEVIQQAVEIDKEILPAV